MISLEFLTTNKNREEKIHSNQLSEADSRLKEATENYFKLLCCVCDSWDAAEIVLQKSEQTLDHLTFKKNPF